MTKKNFFLFVLLLLLIVAAFVYATFKLPPVVSLIVAILCGIGFGLGAIRFTRK